MSKSDPRDALKDIVDGLKSTFGKYNKTARTKAWETLSKPRGKEFVRGLLISPSRPVVGLPRLLGFKEWLSDEPNS